MKKLVLALAVCLFSFSCYAIQFKVLGGGWIEPTTAILGGAFGFNPLSGYLVGAGAQFGNRIGVEAEWIPIEYSSSGISANGYEIPILLTTAIVPRLRSGVGIALSGGTISTGSDPNTSAGGTALATMLSYDFDVFKPSSSSSVSIGIAAYLFLDIGSFKSSSILSARVGFSFGS
jgi:hypothetical protein